MKTVMPLEGTYSCFALLVEDEINTMKPDLWRSAIQLNLPVI